MKTYNILELQKMDITQLTIVAEKVGLTVYQGTPKQNLMYQILDRQTILANKSTVVTNLTPEQ